MRVNYAIVFVSDMSRSVRFYRDVVGLPLKFESPGWTEFATDGATLALHAGAKVDPVQDRGSRWSRDLGERGHASRLGECAHEPDPVGPAGRHRLRRRRGPPDASLEIPGQEDGADRRVLQPLRHRLPHALLQDAAAHV